MLRAEDGLRLWRAPAFKLRAMAGGLQGLREMCGSRRLRADAGPAAPTVARPHGSRRRTDAQSNRASPQDGECGYDAGKKVKGSKHHIVVDTLGLLLAVTVTAASVRTAMALRKSWRKRAARLLPSNGSTPMVRTVVNVLGPSSRPTASGSKSCADPATARPVQQPLWQKPIRGFIVLPRRWVVERTHAWNKRWRRMVMHHDRKNSISTAWVWLAEAHILLSRLALGS